MKMVVVLLIAVVLAGCQLGKATPASEDLATPTPVATPIPATPQLPKIDDTTVSADVCAVVPSGAPVEIYGVGPGPGAGALLVGRARFLFADSGRLIIAVPLNGEIYEGTVPQNDAVRLVGANCPGATPACLTAAEGLGQVAITPSIFVNDRCLELQPGVVTVTWPDAPANFAELEFWTRDDFGNTDVIGVDHDPSDGVGITWTIHPGQRPVLVYVFAYSRPPSPNSGEIAIYVAP